ncbi:carboxypeptidase regulatory-like domain-containing protein [Gemmatimonadota bacterium]
MNRLLRSLSPGLMPQTPPAHAMAILLLAVCGCGFLMPMGLPPSLGAQGVPPGALQGRVWDEEGTPVPGILIRLFRPGEENPVRGAETDDLGYFHIEPVGAGTYLLEASRLGFATEAREIEVVSGERLNVDFTLSTVAIQVEGISVEAERSRDRIRFEEEAGATVRELAGAEIKAIPGLVEADPLRAVEVLPGVITTSDFSSSFNVRGGSADQNLILLDGLPIFNPTHLGGFFSVFNADMIGRAELQSGGFPARFGGRVSSVLDIRTDPGSGSFRGDAGVSLLATRVALAGGIPENWRDRVGLRNAQWRVSGRRSYFDQLLKPVLDFPYHLTDLQGIFQGWTRGGNRISFTAYKGRDVLDLGKLDAEDFPLRINWDWGNDVVGGSWTHPRRDGGWFEVRGGFSRFSSGLAFPDFDDTEVRSLIRQFTLEADWEARVTPYLTLTSGGGLQDLGFDNFFATGGTVFGEGDGRGSDLFGYLQAEWKPSRDWLLELGLRGERWAPSEGDAVHVLSPRVSAKRFLTGNQWAVKLSAGRYTQVLHSIRDEELPLGLDVWVLAGSRAPDLVSDQIQVGLEGYPLDQWFVSLEGYFRDFDGVVTTNFADDPNDDLDDFLAGSGTSYGADFFLRRSSGATTGWLALSWLRATRSFPDFLSGLDPTPEITYPPIFDRRLDVDLVLQRDLGRGLELGLRWNLGTGLPYTRPLGSYAYLSPRVLPGMGLEWRTGSEEQDEEGNYGVVLSDRNAVRYPTRHRLDVSLRWELQRSWGRMTPYLNVLNLYDRRNVLFYFYEFEKSPPVRTGISMFPFLPTLGLEVSF